MIDLPAKPLGMLLWAVFSALWFCSAPPLLFAGAPITSRTTVLHGRDYADALLQGIRDARSSIVCSFYLFKIGEGGNNLPRLVAEELVRARKRGVTVTMILEKSGKDDDPLNDDNRRTASFLAKGGVKVFFDSPRVTTHRKVVVIDNRHVYLGSHNLTQAALRYNKELSVQIESAVIASEILSYLEKE